MSFSSPNSTPLTHAHDWAEPPRLRDFIELTKPRLSLMSVVSAILGYYAAGPAGGVGAALVVGLGCALAAFGAATLNQWWEREADSRMARTADRPLANGRMDPRVALVYGLLLSFAGVAVLYWGTNAIASFLAFATVTLYVLIYTPMKRRTPWALEVGAIPGALPPLIGWMAAGGGMSGLGWILFAYLFVWQIPHFLAISWMCRSDYAAGGFKMLAVSDSSGHRVARKALVWTVLMVGVTFLPLLAMGFGWAWMTATILLAFYILRPAYRFWKDPAAPRAANRLFAATLVHLPIYLSFLAADRFLF